MGGSQVQVGCLGSSLQVGLGFRKPREFSEMQISVLHSHTLIQREQNQVENKNKQTKFRPKSILTIDPETLCLAFTLTPRKLVVVSPYSSGRSETWNSVLSIGTVIFRIIESQSMPLV